MYTKAPLILHGSWAFRFEEGKSLEDAADPSFAATDTMVVPGCFDLLPRWYLKRGTALYRRTFTLEQAVPNAWLVIDGMGLRADFRIDGRPLGVHPYPYSRLEIETGPLDVGEHTLFAALDNRFDWSTMKLARPYYDFYFHGGFYHGVSLVFDNRRLFIRTRDFRTGTVEIEAVNFAKRDFETTLLFDGKNEVAASFHGGRATVRVPDFRLWSPDEPNLHVVELFTNPQIDNCSQITKANGGALGDRALPVGTDLRAARNLDLPFVDNGEQLPFVNNPICKARFGIRTIEARDRRLFLNGEPIFLKGVNRHDTHPDFGPATPEAVMLGDIQNLKALGGNFIRGAHYPQSQRFLDLCDECGVLVWEESLGWGNGQGYTDREDFELADAAFLEQQVAQTRNMVRQSFNHPSVILFGYLNEVASHKPAALALVEKLAAAIRAEDSGRLVTFACNSWKGDLCHACSDVVSFNSYPGTIPCYPGLPDELAEKVRNDPGAGFNTIARHFRELYPDKPILLSESGCAGQYGLRDPAAGWGTEDFQAEYIADILETVRDNHDLVGCCLWQMNDNRTYHRNSTGQIGKPWAGFSAAGIFNGHRQPKLSAAVVKKLFSELVPRTGC